MRYMTIFGTNNVIDRGMFVRRLFPDYSIRLFTDK